MRRKSIRQLRQNRHPSCSSTMGSRLPCVTPRRPHSGQARRNGSSQPIKRTTIGQPSIATVIARPMMDMRHPLRPVRIVLESAGQTPALRPTGGPAVTAARRMKKNKIAGQSTTLPRLARPSDDLLWIVQEITSTTFTRPKSFGGRFLAEFHEVNELFPGRFFAAVLALAAQKLQGQIQLRAPHSGHFDP
jgi:hypothetical protein